jgi:hypothetical protein
MGALIYPRQRNTRTGVCEWVRTCNVSLPINNRVRPRRPWEAITMSLGARQRRVHAMRD